MCIQFGSNLQQENLCFHSDRPARELKLMVSSEEKLGKLPIFTLPTRILNCRYFQSCKVLQISDLILVPYKLAFSFNNNDNK